MAIAVFTMRWISAFTMAGIRSKLCVVGGLAVAGAPPRLASVEVYTPAVAATPGDHCGT